MLRTLFVAAAIATTQSSGSFAQAAVTPAAFAIELTSTPTGWSARCDSGCTWRNASFDCARVCSAVVDANGLTTRAELRTDSASFMSFVERTGSGVRAISRKGTAWSTLTWSCLLANCRAHVDGFGVSKIL